jgi:hypothetical protein
VLASALLLVAWLAIRLVSTPVDVVAGLLALPLVLWVEEPLVLEEATW